jgi:hypothetical protein
VLLAESKTVSYKLKQDPKVCYQSASIYTKPQIDFIQNELQEMIHFFGYAKHGKSDDPTEFFDYGADFVSPSVGYVEHNKRHLEWIRILSPSDLAEIQYDLGDFSKDIKMEELDNHSLAYQDFVEQQMFGKSSLNLK